MTGTDRCLRCPVPAATPCRGLTVRRFCELINPSCDRFDPGYVDVILAESHRMASNWPPAVARLDAAYAAAGGPGQQPGGCCGGAP
jgi:hypothetical protein